MPLIPSAMATQVKASVAGLTGGDTVSIMWNAICNYISANALVTYAWVGLSATVPPTPDPIVIQTGKLIAVPHGAVNQAALSAFTDANAVMSMLGTLMTADQMGWMVQWNDPTFVAASFITVPGTITLSPSGVPNGDVAFTLLCTQICTGLMSAICTPVTPGVHTIYTGTATFTSIT